MTSQPSLTPPWGLFHIYHQPLWSPSVTSIFRKGAIRMWAGCYTATLLPIHPMSPSFWSSLRFLSPHPHPHPRPAPFVSFVLGIITVFLPIPFVLRQLFISPLLLNLSPLSTNQGCQLFCVSALFSPSVSLQLHKHISHPMFAPI